MDEITSRYYSQNHYSLPTMGMFDTVCINSSKLPVSAEKQELLRDADFLTKSLDSVLAHVYITDDSFLEMVGTFLVIAWSSPNPNEKPLKKRYRLTDATGLLNFYTNLDKTRYEFQAIFDEGKLVRLKRAFSHGSDRHYRGETCFRSMEVEVEVQI